MVPSSDEGSSEPLYESRGLILTLNVHTSTTARLQRIVLTNWRYWLGTHYEVSTLGVIHIEAFDPTNVN